MADEVPPTDPGEGDVLARYGALTWRGAAVASIRMTPIVFVIHAASWGLTGLVTGAPRPWSWGRELFGAPFVAFFAVFLLTWWGRRRRSRSAPPPKS